MLKRGFMLTAGAIGLAAAADTAAASMPPRSSSRAAGELRLLGANWRLATPGRQPGEAIQLGDHGALHGDLLGRPEGQGHRAVLRLTARESRPCPAATPAADASVEVHTFVLPEGTIVGMGTSVHGRAVFAIVGGTGAYADAKGSYAATQRLREHGGNGTAEFILTIRA